MFNYMTLTLAQADAPPPTTDAPPPGAPTTLENGAPLREGQPLPPGPQPSPWGMFLPLILLLVVFWLLILMPQRREKKRRTEMLAALRKGDRVQTIGGILGSVVEIREHEVIIKVDESSNTRIHFARAAIQAVLEDGRPAAT